MKEGLWEQSWVPLLIKRKILIQIIHTGEVTQTFRTQISERTSTQSLVCTACAKIASALSSVTGCLREDFTFGFVFKEVDIFCDHLTRRLFMPIQTIEVIQLWVMWHCKKDIYWTFTSRYRPTQIHPLLCISVAKLPDSVNLCGNGECKLEEATVTR